MGAKPKWPQNHQADPKQGFDTQKHTRLYSDRTEHFCGRGPKILTKLFGVGSDMEKLTSSPPEPSVVIRVYQKCQKTKKHEKPGF